MTMFAPPPMDELSPIEFYIVREVDYPERNGRAGRTLGRMYFGANTDGKIFTREDEDIRLEEGNVKRMSATAIPLGRYELTLFDSLLFGVIPVFKDVPGFGYCGIHARGCNESLLGCVEVGDHRTIDGVTGSDGVMSLIRRTIKRAQAEGRKVYCTITREPYCV